MALTLRVTGYDNRPTGAASEHIFDESGGTIGRAPNNDWCLPDPERVVSGVHATIRFDNGEYYVRDSSTNGTLVNTFSLSNGDERPVRNGDHLKIGMYEISVESTDQAFQQPPPPPIRQDPLPGHLPSNLGVDPGETLDPLDLLGKSPLEGTMNIPVDIDFADSGAGAQSDHVSPESMGFEAPRPIPDPTPIATSDNSSAPIPENWDDTGFKDVKSIPVPPPTPGPNPPRIEVSNSNAANRTANEPAVPIPPVHSTSNQTADSHDNIAALLVAAGVGPESITKETYAMLGQILQVVVQGTVDVLKARAQIKDQFRVPATMLKPVENNPLKFSINAQDALQNLFGKTNPGFQSPVDAFHEGYEDIKAHQIAMIAGMRAAYKEMLEYFNPADLEAEFDRGLKRGVLGGALNRAKYWGLYEDLYKSLSKDSDESFHKLFGDVFARAYEEQMQRLSTMRRT